MKKVLTSPGLSGTWLLTTLLLPGAAFSAQTGQAIGTDYPPLEILDKALEYRQFGRVEITGSSIVRKEQTQALPVQVITRREIQNKGHQTVTQVIQSLTSVFNGLDLTQTGLLAGGFTSSALHGMPSGTLVLLNGRRIAPYGIQNISGKELNSVDLEGLPLAAVDRIEVLSDGASSLYGTDAIAGVINIITRTDRKGVEITVDHIRPEGGAGQGARSSISWGRGQLGKDGYSLRVTAELEDHAALKVAQRPGVSQGRQFFTHGGQAYRIDSPKVSPFTAPALIYSPTAAGNKMWSSLYQNGECTQGSLSYDGFEGGCKVNLLPTYDLYPARKSHKWHASGEFQLHESAHVFVEGFYSHQNTTIADKDWTRISGRIVNQEGAVGYAEVMANGLRPDAGFYFFQPNLPALARTQDKSLWRGTLGIKGEFDQWHYQASIYQSGSKVTKGAQYDDLGSLGLKASTPLPSAWALQPLNAQNPLTAQLLNSRQWQEIRQGETQLNALEIRASRPLFELQGRDVLWGVGVEMRQEKASTQYSDATSTLPDFSGQRRVAAAYSELQVPLAPRWDLIASLRHDQYSDVGGTTNGKLASRWAINDQWATRASVGTGFRAPSVGQTTELPQIFQQITLSGLVCTDALRAVAQGLTPTAGSTEVLCRSNNFINVYTNGNPDLKPETSRQTSMGLAFTPSRNFSVSADYWRVQMNNTLQFESWEKALADPQNHAAQFVAKTELVRNPASNTFYNDIALLLKMRNLGASTKEGVDFDVRYRHPGEWGRWLAGVQATYNLKSREKSAADAEWVSDRAVYSASSNTVMPRWRSQWLLALEQAQFQWQVVLNHTSAYKDKDIKAIRLDTGKSETISGRKVPHFITMDLMAIYKANRQTQVRLGVPNVTQAKPPLSFYSANDQVWGANSQNGNLLGRTLQLGLTHQF